MTHLLKKHQNNVNHFMRPPPTPPALAIHRDSRIISKHNTGKHHQHQPQPQQPPPKIRIIHIFAPEIIQTDVANFRELVQRLTGKPSDNPDTTKKDEMININIKPADDCNNKPNKNSSLMRIETAAAAADLETINNDGPSNLETDHHHHQQQPRSYTNYKLDSASKDSYHHQDDHEDDDHYHDYLQRPVDNWSRQDHIQRPWFVDSLEGVECFLPADIGDFHFNGFGDQHNNLQLSYRG